MLVIETSGQLVCAYGERMIPDIAILGSLIAGDLAASKEIASITGEYQNYQLIIREGEYTNLVISEIGKQMALLAAFTRDVPIGWARKLIQNASSEIDELLKTPQVNIEKSDNEVEEGDLPDLYNEALSQIWKE
jgi:predicted regulator of Ras-like GTPase activity (Roadblock/LC7/MglB family)